MEPETARARNHNDEESMDLPAPHGCKWKVWPECPQRLLHLADRFAIGSAPKIIDKVLDAVANWLVYAKGAGLGIHCLRYPVIGMTRIRNCLVTEIT